MSDFVGFQRRQPPSPLVFTPETVLPPVLSQTNSGATSSHGSGSNTVSMPFVRRHVTRRLKTAKADCDKELRRVVNSVTTFFEERLRDGDHEREVDRDYREREEYDRDSQYGDSEALQEAFIYRPSDPRPASQASQADSYTDGGYEAELEGRHSRQRALLEEDGSKGPSLTHRASSPGLLAVSNSSSLSPSLRRQNTLPWEKSTAAPSSSSAVPSPVVASATLADTASPRSRQSGVIPPTAWPTQGLPSRRLSRSIHIPTRPVRSGQSSRSTSRSRSPLPPAPSHSSFSDAAPMTSSINRRSSRILVDDPVDPIMTTLYELIGVATDVTEMSTAQLTAQPKLCESLVQRVQSIGKAWDDHPDWHGRNWYVQVLLAVASLSRVLEWWEAEKQFWNFDDNEDEQDDPLMFVLKPADEPSPVPTPSARHRNEEGALRLTADDENRLRLTRPTSQGRRSRDESLKDLSVTSTSPEPPSRSPNKVIEHNESARVLATERLRLQAETAQNENIVIELSLDGDHFIWVNYAWRVVVGTDPAELPGTRISRLTAPPDWDVFREATTQLHQDDSHTVEVRFRLQVEPEGERDPSASGLLYQPMEGKGMLMIDREDGQPSHTMWVVKPIAPPQYEHPSPSIVLESGAVGDEPAAGEELNKRIAERSHYEPVTPFPFTQPISNDPILCRICECQIPQWYFEKHSETCVEVHRLEAEIAECNESISELRNTIRDLLVAVEASSSSNIPEYRGVPIFSPSSSPGMSSPLQLFRSNKMQRMSVKKVQRRLLDQLDDILQVASEISMPSLKEEESKEPIERQRLLSPTSEGRMSRVRNWCKPTIEDPALAQLEEDAERVMRQKVDNVVRMQNTIRYSEKIWHEWEEKVEQSLAIVEDDEDSDDESAPPVRNRAVPSVPEEEWPVNHEEASTEPTPMASSSPVPIATPSEHRTSVSMPIPTFIPPSWQIINKMPTRSSTPSSISSPLALAAPINASPSPDEHPPYMDLNDIHPENATIRTRRSASNLLEPRLLVTPPLSPSILPRDVPTTRRGHRRHSTVNPILSPSSSSAPLSPRQPSAAPLQRSTPTSIKDFDIIKPISKGAFGSVFLAKKKATGDYYAIKVLKKADMIAKNQITNVKAERMILMKQAESPFVAKLYFTFQSKENLYLVMEYLNGGDCAALIKSLGSLPEEWTKNYIAEVVLGLEYLHQRGVVHRDLKPDNLLIDQHGHLKLTDFGLSRIGLLGRQTREGPMGLRPRTRYDSRSRPPSMDSGFLSSPLLSSEMIGGGSYFSQGTHTVPRLGSSPYHAPTDDVSESSGSESLSNYLPRRSNRAGESPLQSFATELTTDLRSHSGGNTPPGEQKFVGTPDYLAPETILGLRGDDAAVDWWALGVITYEFLYGIPPFHAESPEKVFENILSGHIEWHEDWVEFSDDARDFMQRLMTIDIGSRLGANGAEEVKSHPFFDGVEWDKVTSTEAAFIPQVSDPESTDYFDPRGAIPQLFHDEDIAVSNPLESPAIKPLLSTTAIPPLPTRDVAPSPAGDDFGSFSFKNLPVLKQANDDVIRKLKTDQLAPIAHTLSDPTSMHTRRRSISQRIKKPPSVVTALDQKSMSTGPPSPSTSTSSIASSPSRASVAPSTPGSSVGSHARKPSEFGALERFKLNHLDGVERRNTMPSRLRTASISSSAGDASGSDNWPSSGGQGSSQFEVTPPSSVHSIDLRKGPDPSDRAVTCLLAEDNPITAKIIETLLIRLGCRCVVVADGSEAISVAMGDIKFDCILMDLQMPVLDGESAARYIKSTNSKNTTTPIIAVSAYSAADTNELNSLFAASLAKPLQRADLLAVMRKLGFKTSAVQGVSVAAKITASRVS
ncbi:RIM15, signal transduction response regulator [Leucogyrophana mollusca]|uniref:RIM15, signal transduction response regulator n=1 Tax=Leucogyrophana mollusca TaxID=85980 RepID=A0ACB8C0B3_9AGAM|nr:RIM15, signal transduction response regulator [Leucogyrophana mollusca]